ncbi:hypothetical protein EN742_17465 [Mesorhizobium sp. M4A.F.Ca.ET.020.02.1.1]|uniref:HK97 family phage prohead protease n=1 Tax=unclassified Mesorhizobium TaxID=325217 RepID=UPI000FD2EC3F|nr:MULTISPECIES: HK97 family phage prohead protease [unclassified Mesorhizobium]RVD38556.1 hypothetical protein EN742_17465 [Mesorhizobium sp. M4A.F.Ca.ET.020.02.1.1]RWC10915.1 MAG: hypothetical protein EOS53_28290 [Mesorhizobium sp.]
MTTTQRALARTPSRARLATVAGRASNYGVLCGRYIIEPGAFQSLTNDPMPKMLMSHEGPEIGEWLSVSEDEQGLYVAGRLWDNQPAREAISLYLGGDLIGLSLGPKKRCRWKTMRCGILLISHIEAIDEISLARVPGDPAALITQFLIGAGQ